ncbi:MAG TPA: tripartite tricarboxylate transporter substrate binding protein [Rhodocyclaceae bacterium]|nr:tripartite tricarboxylate transporter substrate binding protein [Rhodocyclaceae bacterium]
MLGVARRAGRFVRGCLGVVLALSATMAVAQGYPNKPIRVIVPAAAGGITDVIGRAMAQRLSEVLGQSVVVENKAGANGIIGMEALAKAAPDGYTIGVGYSATLSINPGLYSKLPYDVAKDYAPITAAISLPLILIAHPSFPAKNLSELIAVGRSQPGKYSYGTAGVGATGHLSMELFKTLTGVDFTHVPYKGNAPAYADLLAGQVQLMFGDVPSALTYLKAGRIHAYAITTQQRSPLAPEVPTVREAGLSGFESNIVFGFIAPAGVPKDIIQRLNTEMVKILREPAFAQRFAAQAVEMVPTTPEGYAELIRTETAKWARVIKASGAKAD